MGRVPYICQHLFSTIYPTPRIGLFVLPWRNLPHHRYIHQDQEPGSKLCASYICKAYTYASRSGITDTCIIHTCIRIEDDRYMHHAYMQLHHRYMHLDQGSIIKDHEYMHHACMHQDQGTRTIDICIIHTCIIPKYIRVEDKRYMQHTHMHQDQGS